MRDLLVAMTLVLRDQLSRPIAQSMRNVSGSANEATRAIDRTSRTSQRMSEARERLGIRSEQSIRREVQQTEAAYNRLARSGALSAQEQARAMEATRRKVAELKREMGTMPAPGGLFGRGVSAAGRGLNNFTTVAGGAAAGVMVAAAPVKRTMAYDERLAMMANTAYADRDAAGRIAGKKELDESIRSAVRFGGGSRDQAADTLDALLASGALKKNEALAMLPSLQRASTATGADPTALADIALRSMQNFNIQREEVPKVLDMALAAGQAGGFELRDMAKWLPQQMAVAKNAGLGGMDGLATLLAANHAAKTTTGSSDQAGNAVFNLLGKISSQDTAKDAQRMGIDLTGTLAAAREKGTNSLDAFANLVQKIVGSDKRYQALEAKLNTAGNDDERQATLESMRDLIQGSAIGKLVQDREALLGLVGYMKRGYVNDVKTKTLNSKDAVETNFAVMADTASFKTERLANEKAFAEQDAMTGFNRALGTTSEVLADYASHYPGLSASMVGATTMLTALAASAGAVSMINLVKGGGAAGAAGTALSAGSGSLLAAAVKLTGGLLVAGAAGAAIGTGWNWFLNKSVQVATGEKDATWGGKMHDLINGKEDGRVTLEGVNAERAKAGKAPLSRLPWEAGSETARATAASGQPPAGMMRQAPADPMAGMGRQASRVEQLMQTSQPIEITTKLTLDGREIAQAVNQHNGRQAGRN